MPNRHVPGCRCCQPACTAWKDSFNRADDTDIGADWTEDAGDWEIVSNELTTSDSDAELVRDAGTYVSGESDYYLKFKASDGDEIKLYDAPSTDSRETLVITVGASSKLQAYDDSNTLVHECDVTIPADEWVTLRIRCSEIVYINDVEVFQIADIAFGSIRVLGTGTISGAVYFDDYDARFVESEEHPDCPACAGECAWFPDREVCPISFEISGATDRWNGTYWEYYSRLNGMYEAAELNSPFDCWVKISGLDIDVVEETGSEVNVETIQVHLAGRQVRVVKDTGFEYFTYDKYVGAPGDLCSGNMLTLPDNGPSLTEVGVATIEVP